MKKSMAYHMAMLSVLDDKGLSVASKLEIIEVLIADKRLAIYSEEQGAKKAEVSNGCDYKG